MDVGCDVLFFSPFFWRRPQNLVFFSYITAQKKEHGRIPTKINYFKF